MNKIRLIIDIDGTLCPVKTSQEQYAELRPYPNMVDKIKEYKEQGATITLFTSRNMNTYKDNIGLINANTAKVLLQWLDKWDIPYDEILYGKPWPGHCGFYVDDRSVRPDEFLKYSLDELEALCRGSQAEGGGGHE